MTAPEALAAATEFAPDLALLDIGLPVMDGTSLRSGAGRDEQTPQSSSWR